MDDDDGGVEARVGAEVAAADLDEGVGGAVVERGPQPGFGVGAGRLGVVFEGGVDELGFQGGQEPGVAVAVVVVVAPPAQPAGVVGSLGVAAGAGSALAGHLVDLRGGAPGEQAGEVFVGVGGGEAGGGRDLIPGQLGGDVAGAQVGELVEGGADADPFAGGGMGDVEGGDQPGGHVEGAVGPVVTGAVDGHDDLEQLGGGGAGERGELLDGEGAGQRRARLEVVVHG